ncbi:hypothetical protein P2H44_03350 [Albimonas sp. CAU 1670]|uniref:hypothetical protein n=1 Tax=Albimonas sp. CAU 1670 TaxID=3032599 RepID=UPI0023DB1BFF|nr:hypothetical protein [Albimonas sp. CAU 1670]MDF2231580.1 hypothetical protein [Albimonas sp. CAU 1670]
MSAAEHLAILEALEDSVAKSTNRLRDLRKRADDLYQERVQELMQEHGCDMHKANYLAATDPTASRAYQMSLEIAEDEIAETRAGLAAAAPLR